MADLTSAGAFLWLLTLAFIALSILLITWRLFQLSGAYDRLAERLGRRR